MKQERNALREKNEELTLSEVSRTTGGKTTMPDSSDSNGLFMADLPPEARSVPYKRVFITPYIALN